MFGSLHEPGPQGRRDLTVFLIGLMPMPQFVTRADGWRNTRRFAAGMLRVLCPEAALDDADQATQRRLTPKSSR